MSDGEGAKEKVRAYFDAGAEEFDRLYSAEKSRLGAWLDRRFRWDVQARFEETMNECSDVAGLEILDVGCGSGRYSVRLARRGARVTGIDCAPRMLALARRRALSEGVAERCRFVEGDVLTAEFDQPFSVTIAVGFFDYIAEPRSYLLKLRRETRGKLIATFPRLWTWRAPVRKVRLALLGCPVYFFTKREVKRLLGETDWKIERIETVGKLHFVVARAREA